jgi:oligoribonuclease NrnB/cAMP/cGMP phosphodiesterase (DHH superfamily)
MAKIAEVADKVVVLDHHITAKNELTNWPNKPDNVEVVFNMEASGAYLAWWRFAATDEACPLIVAYAQDHDLWQFKLPNSRQIRAWLQTVPREGFAAVDRANDLLTDSFPMCVAVGHALEQATQERCYQIANISTAHCEGKYRVANTTSDMSEVGSYLLERFPECEVSMTYFDDLKTGTRRFSLRSRNGGFDVSELAKSLGGGGHASAAGFETYIDSRLPYEALK